MYECMVDVHYHNITIIEQATTYDFISIFTLPKNILVKKIIYLSF